RATRADRIEAHRESDEPRAARTLQGTGSTAVMKIRVGVWLMAAGLLAGCGRMPVTTATAERLDSVVAVRQDGGLEVEEAFAIAPDASGTVVFHRVIESPYADVLRFVSA